MYDLDRHVWKTSGVRKRAIWFSLRTACPGARRWDVLALQPAWAIIQVVCAAVARDMLTPHQHIHLKHAPEFARLSGTLSVQHHGYYSYV